MVNLAGNGDSLGSFISQNNAVAEGGGNFLKSLLLCFTVQTCQILVNASGHKVVVRGHDGATYGKKKYAMTRKKAEQATNT
jgi:hypothetical protein